MKKKLSSLLILFLLYSCAHTTPIDYQPIDDNLKVANVQLSMNEQQVIDSLKSEYHEENCILGKELIFDKLGIDIVFDTKDHHIVRLITKNKDSVLYGAVIGERVEDLSNVLLARGYVAEDNSKYKFIKDDFRITILSSDGNKITGFMIDVLEK